MSQISLNICGNSGACFHLVLRGLLSTFFSCHSFYVLLLSSLVVAT
jgi:hypothetical protein